MKVVFDPNMDHDYVPLVLTPNKVYDVIKIIDEIFYQIKADDDELRTYYKELFQDIDKVREKKINEIISWLFGSSSLFYYLCLMNNTKVERAIYLQKKANDQIDTYGEASHDVVDELMEIVDSLNDGEQSLMLELYYK